MSFGSSKMQTRGLRGLGGDVEVASQGLDESTELGGGGVESLGGSGSLFIFNWDLVDIFGVGFWLLLVCEDEF